MMQKKRPKPAAEQAENTKDSGKVAGLKRLENLGLQVPVFLVYSASNPLAIEKDPTWQAFLEEDKSYAVRSSYQGEDAEEDSHAGVFESILHVKKADVPGAVAKVIASAMKEQASSYQEKRALAKADSAKMDVIVQEMVDSEISGILFTHNPRGLLHEALIEIAYGFGDALMDGTSLSQSYAYYVEGNHLEHSAREGAPYLNREMQEYFCDFIAKWHEEEKAPSDFEFAIDKSGQIYFLQIRPITTLRLEDPILLDDSNIQESYPGITLPLSIDFAKRAYKGVFQRLGQSFLGEKIQEESIWQKLSSMVESYQGHMYYQISNWYSVLLYLPFSKKIIGIWQKMLGVKNKSISKKLEKPSFWRKLFFFPRFLRVFRKTPALMNDLDQRFLTIEKDFRAKMRGAKDTESLRSLFATLESELLEDWYITLVNDLYAFFYTGLVERFIDDKEFLARMKGEDGLASMEPVWALEDLAKAKDTPAYEAKKAAFIDLFGDRSREELKLETKTFRSHPETFDAFLESYQPTMQFSREQAVGDQEKTALTIQAKGIKGWLLKRWLQKARTGIENREQSRFHRSRIYGMAREIVLAFADYYVEKGALDTREDVFYLHLDEMLEAQGMFQERVEERKQAYTRYKNLPSYPRLVFDHEIIPSGHEGMVSQEQANRENRFQGVPVSNGVAEGEIVIVRGPEEKVDVKDKILVAALTDPAWVYLMVQAKALICEKGSLLSHTGIIARELGIPAITGLTNATQIFRDGQRLRVDGNQGTVEILEEAKAKDAPSQS